MAVKLSRLFVLFIISPPLLYAQPPSEFSPRKIHLTDFMFGTEIKKGYLHIPNYGQYVAMGNSLCFQKNNINNDLTYPVLQKTLI